MGTMPDCLLAGGVVVVEARGVGVEQLPPLVVVRLLSATHPNRKHRSARRATLYAQLVNVQLSVL